MTGSELIARERQRQIDVEGWTPEHDATHNDCQLNWVAMAYMCAARLVLKNDPAATTSPAFWPWSQAWWKPSRDPIRNLVKAGALIAAEIDRLQREQEKS